LPTVPSYVPAPVSVPLAPSLVPIPPPVSGVVEPASLRWMTTGASKAPPPSSDADPPPSGLPPLLLEHPGFARHNAPAITLDVTTPRNLACLSDMPFASNDRT
jgi:hypothetical protein